MDYDAKMAAMKNMMDYADGMEDEQRKPVGIGSAEYNSGVDPTKTSQMAEEDEGGEKGGGGGGMDMGGIMSMFSKFMGK